MSLESTSLSKCIARQGIKIPIRHEIRPKTRKHSKKDDDSRSNTTSLDQSPIQPFFANPPTPLTANLPPNASNVPSTRHDSTEDLERLLNQTDAFSMHSSSFTDDGSTSGGLSGLVSTSNTSISTRGLLDQLSLREPTSSSNTLVGVSLSSELSRASLNTTSSTASDASLELISNGNMALHWNNELFALNRKEKEKEG